MVNNAKIEIEIDNNKIEDRISALLINQRMDWHHTFEVRYQLSGKELNLSDLLEKDIGKTIKIKIERNSKSFLFKGIITRVKVDRSNTAYGELILEGYSPTILLDGNPHCRYLNDVKLNDIVKKITDEVPMNVKTTINPGYSMKFKHFMQYKETNYNFLKRIAELYGEWFYYSGTELFFGTLNSGSAIEMELNYEILSIKLSAELFPLKFQDKYYNYIPSAEYTSQSGSVSGLDSLGKKAHDKSKSVFSHSAITLNPTLVADQNDLKALVEARNSAIAGNMVTLTGTSNNTEIAIGSKINVKNYGNYIITELEHSCNLMGTYLNRFKAIPASLSMPPYFPIRLTSAPICEIQNAKVTATNDPEDLGRVRVKFYWQEGNEQTWWMRVLTPTSGKDKGSFFIPEIEDDVLIAFEDNNPNKPYVLGSVFHGKTKPAHWKNSKNYIKGIKTVSGNEVFINDEGGKETIKIQQKDAKNEIVITLEGDGKITLTTKGDMIFKATKSISFDAGEEIKMKSTKGTTLEAMDVKITAKKGMEMKGMDVKVNADTNLEMKANAEAKLEGLNVTIDANVAAALKGKATAEVSSVGQTAVKGTIVMIN